MTLMRKTIHISSMMMLFPISAAIIGVSSAVDVPLQHANAVSIDDDDGTTSSCRHHISDTSEKCSKNDTPLILPFP
jgi:hypothetical protein